ncbi:hypothetical protein OC861_002742 [Tilletia horrida]|nr:hypothetical protein OC861_002742 [Tilletia horrida]
MSGNAPGEGSTPSYTKSALYSAIYGAGSATEAGTSTSSSAAHPATATSSSSAVDGASGGSAAPAWSAALRFAPRARAGQSSSGAAGSSTSAAALARSRSIPSSLAVQPSASTSNRPSSTSASALSSAASTGPQPHMTPTTLRSSTSAPKIATAFQSSSHNPFQDEHEDENQEDEDGFDKWASSNSKRGASGPAGTGPAIKMPRTNARAIAARPRVAPGSAATSLNAAIPPPISSVHGRPSLQRPTEANLASSSSSAAAAAAYSVKKTSTEQTQKQQDLKRPRPLPVFGPPPIALSEEELANDKELARVAAERRGEVPGGAGKYQEEEDDEDAGLANNKRKWKKKKNKNDAPALNMDADYDPRLPNDYIAFRALLRERRQAEADLARERKAASRKHPDDDEWLSDEEDEENDYRDDRRYGKGYDDDRHHNDRRDEEHRRRMMKFAPPSSYGPPPTERRADDRFANHDGRHGSISSGAQSSSSKPMTYGERAEMEAREAERQPSGRAQHYDERTGADSSRDRDYRDEPRGYGYTQAGADRGDRYHSELRHAQASDHFAGWGHEVLNKQSAPSHAPQGFAPSLGTAPTKNDSPSDNSAYAHNAGYRTDAMDTAAIPGFVTSRAEQVQQERIAPAEAPSAPSSSSAAAAAQVDVAEAIRRAKQIAQSLTVSSQAATAAPSTAAPATEPSATSFIHPSRLAQMGAQDHHNPGAQPPADTTMIQQEQSQGQEQRQEQHAWSADKSGVVARLMAQMGHKEGEGIGADGNRGRVVPLSVKASSNSSRQQQKKNADRDGSSRSSGAGGGGGGSFGKRGTIVGGHTTADGAASSLERDRYGASSEVVLLENMVDASGLDDDLGDEIREECSKFGRVARVFIYPVPASSDVRIFVAFEGPAGAWQAVRELDGRFFGGRTVRARYYPRETFQKGSYLD